jgi:hypothetical protein
MTRRGDLRTEGRCGHGSDKYRRRGDGTPYCKECVRLRAIEYRRAHGVKEAPTFANAAESFWSKVDRSNADGCWPWTAAATRGGYGAFVFHRKSYRATRFALEMHLGRKLETDEYACHHCDNPPCVRPDHLFAGSAKANIEDAVAKGRMAIGERNGRNLARFHGMRRPALTPGQVEIVRLALAEGFVQAHIAAFMGCSEAAVSRIAHGTRHLGAVA